jgi:hypothetical protein
MPADEPSTNAYAISADSLTDVVVTLRITKELADKTMEASKAIGLRRSDVMRLSLDRGLERLLEQLDTKGGEA